MAAHEYVVTMREGESHRGIKVRAERFEYSREDGMVRFWVGEEVVVIVSDPFLVSVVRRDAR